MTAAPAPRRARLTRTDRGLRVDDWLPTRPSPGGVAVCLSGGGTRSMLASAGQLRALKALGWLAKTKAIVGVSGGAWALIPFSYLPPDRDEDDLLGRFVADPAALRFTPPPPGGEAPGCGADPGAGDPADLAAAAPESLVRVATRPEMAAAHAAAWILWWMQPVHLGRAPPLSRLWESYIAMTILAPLGFSVDRVTGAVSPADSFFCWDPAHEASLRAGAADLPEVAYLAAPGDAPGRTPRPLPITTTALLAHAHPQAHAEPFRFLAPVHVTPFFTGVPGRAGARNDHPAAGWFRRARTGGPVGGGGPASFAFGARRVREVGADAEVAAGRCFSLADAAAAASCVFAERLRTRLVDRPADLRKTAVWEALESVLSWVGGPAVSAALWVGEAELARGEALAPSYRYWAPGAAAGPPGDAGGRGASGGSGAAPLGEAPRREDAGSEATFVDGGSLDNIGVPTALAYEDVRRVVAFVNAGSALRREPGGVVLDDPIPPLFGLRGAGPGYEPFPPLGAHRDDQLAQRRFNQVFETRRFDEMREGLAAAAAAPGGVAAFLQPGLRVLENPWFGVRGGRAVDVLWVYLHRSEEWAARLTDPALRRVASAAWFPHWDTWSPRGPLEQAGLLAHFTSWVTARNAPALAELYAGDLRPVGPPGARRFACGDPELGLPGPYLDARAFVEGRAAVRGPAGWGFVDTRGAPVGAANYAAVGDFAEGFAPVRFADAGGGGAGGGAGWDAVVDRAGAVRWRPAGEGERLLGCAGGVARVAGPGGVAWVDLATDARLEGRGYPGGPLVALGDFRDGFAWARRADGATGVLARDLVTWAVEPGPLEVVDGGLGEAMAVAREPGDGAPAWRVFDLGRGGGFALKAAPWSARPPRRVGGFREGLLRLDDGETAGFVDRDGRPAFPARRGRFGDFGGGLAAFRAADAPGWAYVDRRGAVAIDGAGSGAARREITRAGPFAGGLAEVELAAADRAPTRTAVIDRRGALRDAPGGRA